MTTGVTEVLCFGVTAIFTPPGERGQGFAKHMMRLLHWVLASHSSLPKFPPNWGEPPTERNHAKFSVLYSDIGLSFYPQCGPGERANDGWQIKDEMSTIWNVHRAESRIPEERDWLHIAGAKKFWKDDEDVMNVHQTESLTPGVQWDWLDSTGAEKVWEDDEDVMKHELFESARLTGSASCMFLPGNGVGAFQIRRATSYASEKHLCLQSNKWGIQRLNAGIADADSSTFATWSFDIEPNLTTLVVTRLRANVTTFRDLIHRILGAARLLHAQRVEIWNLAESLERIATELGGQTLKREEHLPGIRVYEEESTTVDWLFNEK